MVKSTAAAPQHPTSKGLERVGWEVPEITALQALKAVEMHRAVAFQHHWPGKTLSYRPLPLGPKLLEFLGGSSCPLAPGGGKQDALQHHLPPAACADTEVATGGDSRICAGAYGERLFRKCVNLCQCWNGTFWGSETPIKKWGLRSFQKSARSQTES